ncbi:unnamed protein product [Hymenolepis diminuta]|uniref:Uncharacterized protein n=1 Tax=Hymenolepis diminuta TaxID=6216 RepID=A0A564ZB31_HYMDI|nr:unnamed protein product [Hymenolepis diminuta]
MKFYAGLLLLILMISNRALCCSRSNNGETEDDGSFEFRYPVAAAPVTGVWSSIGLIVLPILSYLLFRM